MPKNWLPVFIIIALIGWGCSAGDSEKQAVITGNFSIADSINHRGDLLPVSITIIRQADGQPDTLFREVTDSSGFFSGKAYFPERGEYPAMISRSGRPLSQLGIILADGDSVEIRGRFPEIDQTVTISSGEHDAMRQFGNLNRGFQRISQFANAGKLHGDSLEQELLKWSNLYMDLFRENEDTKAGELAVSESVRLLEGWNNPTMMKRIREVQHRGAFAQLAAEYGKDYMAQSQGLDAALAYLDTLAEFTEDTDQIMYISRERIGLLYDSARVQLAQKELEAFQIEYTEDSTAQSWAESINYDLNYLSPGDQVPEFEFAQKGKRISHDSLLGNTYILEVTRLSNALYQEQFDRTVVIHSIYKNYGLNLVTLPLDESQITVDAFFDERIKPWPVSDAQAFDRKELLETFNIRMIPTRFLIDKEGKIVRKYVGREFQDIVKDLQNIITKE